MMNVIGSGWHHEVLNRDTRGILALSVSHVSCSPNTWCPPPSSPTGVPPQHPESLPQTFHHPGAPLEWPSTTILRLASAWISFLHAPSWHHSTSSLRSLKLCTFSSIQPSPSFCVEASLLPALGNLVKSNAQGEGIFT